jgi:hypothetical protein
VATSTYGFPKHDLTAAIAAAEELAGQHRDGTTRRLNPDGSIDVAATEGWFRRRFLLYRVSPEGTTALVETTSAPPAYKVSVAMMLGGGALFAASVLSAIFGGDGGQNTEFGLGVLAFIVCLIGVVRSNRFGLSWYVGEISGSDSDWQQLYAPTKWAPQSVDQLRAVERLADEHGGKALARPHPDGGTQVRTLKHGRLHTHVVAPDGTLLLVSRGEPALLYTLGTGTMAIGVGGAVVTIVLYNLTDLEVEAAWYVSLGLLFVGVVLRALVTLEKRGKDQAAVAWHLVQTKPDDTD